MARTGAPWRDLPAEAGISWNAVASRFYRWTSSGVWQEILAELQRDADDRGVVDRSKQFVDGSAVRAHQHAAGARASSQEREALGRGRGGFSMEFHVRAEGRGLPLSFVVTAGQRHEARTFEPLMEAHWARRAAVPALEGRPGCVVGDKGYSYGRIRRQLAHRGIGGVTPLRRDQGTDAAFDRATYRERNRAVERLVDHLKQWRRIATRYEKRATNYLAMLTLAAIVLWR